MIALCFRQNSEYIANRVLPLPQTSGSFQPVALDQSGVVILGHGHVGMTYEAGGSDDLLSGHIGVASGTNSLIPGGIAAETRQALENIKRTLEANESSVDRVFKCTVMLADIGEWEPMSAVYREYLPHKPARSTFGTGGLALGARVEIECIATVR